MAVLAEAMKNSSAGNDNVSATHWSIVLLAAEHDANICKLLRNSLSSMGSSAEKDGQDLAVVLPAHDINSMLRACTRADIVVPVMSPALESDEAIMRVLVWCEKSGKGMVPAKLNTDGYNQSGWLGAMMAGRLWFDVHVDVPADKLEDKEAGLAEMKPKAELLLTETKGLAHGGSIAEELVGSGCEATGWYIEPSNGSKQQMHFEFFSMTNGMISGQGQDVVEKFVISGTYQYNASSKTGSIKFSKSYTGTQSHVVTYTGQMHGSPDSGFEVEGQHNYGGAFSLSLSLADSVSHVMISYQWNSQSLVKSIVETLKGRGVPVWFDIDGDMKGNINVAMANGVEKAMCIVSFHSDAYSKSVNCRKELAYAASVGKPIIPINVEAASFSYTVEESSPHHWIAKICEDHGVVPPITIDKPENAALDTLCAAIDKVSEVTAKPPPPAATSTTASGCKNPFAAGGSVTGWYTDSGKKCDMKFEFFKMSGGRVVGQGDDQVSPFTIAGVYKEEAKEFYVEFKKSYCGKYQHVVRYTGVVRGNSITGEHNYGGEFMIAIAGKE